MGTHGDRPALRVARLSQAGSGNPRAQPCGESRAGKTLSKKKKKKKPKPSRGGKPTCGAAVPAGDGCSGPLPLRATRGAGTGSAWASVTLYCNKLFECVYSYFFIILGGGWGFFGWFFLFWFVFFVFNINLIQARARSICKCSYFALVQRNIFVVTFWVLFWFYLYRHTNIPPVIGPLGSCGGVGQGQERGS